VTAVTDSINDKYDSNSIKGDPTYILKHLFYTTRQYANKYLTEP